MDGKSTQRELYSIWFTSQVKQNVQKDFILSVGDMWTDLTDTKYWIKLPCTRDNKNILTDITNV